MTISYDYPQVSGGYRWNMLQRCLNEVGIEPVASGDIGGRTVLTFSRALIDTEKQKLDILMADNPTFPPVSGGTRYVVRDVWNQKDYFQTQLGMTYQIYYSESVVGSGNVDQIEIVFPTTLTPTQKNKVTTEYAKLISVKP